MTENVKILALRLFNRIDEHISSQLLLVNNNKHSHSSSCFVSRSALAGFTGPHRALFHKIAELVALVLEMKGWNVNAADFTGGTALAWAARRWHKDSIKSLFKQKDINSDQADPFYGRTPLSRVTENGNSEVVDMLLGQEGVGQNRADTVDGQRRRGSRG